MIVARILPQPFLPKAHTGLQLDYTLLTLVLLLMSIGWIMVTSASIDYAATNHGDPWFYAKRHGVYLFISVVASLVLLSIPTTFWRTWGWVLFFVALALLIAVLIPGIGRKVNGSQRWLNLGPFTLQASEVAKFCSIIFFASFLHNAHVELKTKSVAILKPLGLLLVLVLLLLLEPDFGGAVVLSVTVGSMLFLAGAKLWQCLLLLIAGLGAMACLAVFSPYRLKRLVTFLDPWANQFDSGYQLTQSLIAFGQGQFFGVGLGNSVQKLLYLPEAHTDFIFAILAEEQGFIGVCLVLALFVLLIHRIFDVTRTAVIRKNIFVALVSFGVGILLSCQVIINVGVASGFMPTKGLTLPFISYGGSSLLMSCGLVALILRFKYDLDREAIQKPKRRKRK